MATDSHPFACNDRRVSRVLEYVAQDLSKRPTLPDVARIAGLETTYFSRRFRAVVGITFVEWNRQLRMEQAKQLLAIVDLSITGVAATVGYGDVTTFTRAFKHCTNVCPRAYRRQLWFEDRERRNCDKKRRDDRLR